MTDAQFIEFMAKLDSLWMLIFCGFIVVLCAIGLVAGQQR
ncbi:putative membrane protein [Vibrio vulnificus]|nr:putative membrane protein [Vibrio vulnificus]